MSLTILGKPGLDPKTLPLKEKIRLVKESEGLLIDLLEGEMIDINLNLAYCTFLTHLPNNIEINGWLELEGCISLTRLPEGLVVNDWLSLEGCISLTHLPDNLVVGRSLYLLGCTSLKEIPKTIKVRGDIFVPDHLK